MKSVLFALNSIEKTLFNEECKESLKLSILDDQCIEQTEGLCDAIKAEVLQSTTVVTDVTILMYSKLKNQLNYDSVQ